MTQVWQTMPTQMLLERASAFARQQEDREVARCIDALVWRLKGAEEWIASMERRNDG